ncbi:MAG: HU family DNA-binding protein [Calditrichaeota bacterium]|nr:MAG: HU family DNA-binding protein [Calditrichota bacterium]
MNRKELIDALAQKTDSSKKDAEKFLAAFLETVTEELKRGGSVNLVGFGSFKVQERAARQGRNPQTNETIQIPARRVPVFKAGKELKSAL